MLIQKIDLFRFIVIYFVQLAVGGIFFILIATLILKRSTKQLNQIFSMFFISVAIGTICNVIYAALRDPLLVLILHIMTYFFYCWAMVFLLLFNLIILKSRKIVDRKNQLRLIGVWSLVLAGLFIIGLSGGVQLDESTQWKPKWNIFFFSYGFLACLIMFIPTIYTSLRVYKNFDEEIVKKRWRYFIVGTLFYYFILVGASVVNLIANEILRTIWGVVLLFTFSSIYILYYGVAKQLE